MTAAAWCTGNVHCRNVDFARVSAVVGHRFGQTGPITGLAPALKYERLAQMCLDVVKFGVVFIGMISLLQHSAAPGTCILGTSILPAFRCFRAPFCFGQTGPIAGLAPALKYERVAQMCFNVVQFSARVLK